MARRTCRDDGYTVLLTVLIVLALVVRVKAVVCPGFAPVTTTSTDDDQSTATFTFDQPENYTCTPASGSSFALGTNTVTCSPNGSDGQQCTFQVIVNDEQPPTVANCPTHKSSNTNLGASTGTATWRFTASDNVGVITVTCSPSASGELFPIGITNVTCTATDAAGNKANCQFLYTIIDNEDPVITGCPDDMTSTIELVNSQLPSQTSVVTWDQPATSDNSGEPVDLTSTHEKGSAFPIGVTNVIYSAADENGNSATCEFKVRVMVQPPNNNIMINNARTTASDVCLTVTWPESADQNVDEYSIYAYEQGEVRPDSSQRMVVPSGTNTYIKHDVCRLQPGELYTIEVNGDQQSSVNHWTKPNAPGEVTLVQGTLSTSSFTFAWQRSTQNVEQYYWQCTQSGRLQDGYVINTTDTVSIESARPGTRVYVYVQAVVGSGNRRDFSSATSKLISTASLRQSELLAYNYTESTINLVWDTSSSTGTELDPYMLFIEPRDADENYLRVSNGYVEFKGLRPNTEYQIRLISNLGLMLETTQKTRPGRVANLRPTDVLKDSITLAWDEPLEGAVESYDIWISPGEKSEPFNEDGTSHTFNQLTNNTEYFFKVVSIHEGMRSVPQTLMVTTGVTKPWGQNIVNTAAIIIGVVLGLLVLVLTVVLIVTYLKYRKLIIKNDSLQLQQPRRKPANVEQQYTEETPTSAPRVDSNDSYEQLAVDRSASKHPKDSHAYQNTKFKPSPRPVTNKKIPKLPMLPVKGGQQPDYAVPDING